MTEPKVTPADGGWRVLFAFVTQRPAAAEFCRWGPSMKRAVRLGVLASIVGCFIGCISGPRDRERDVILSLPWQQFDQTLNSGWRVYSARREYRAAADLLEHFGQPLGSWKSR